MQKYKKQSSGFRNSVSNIKIGSLMKRIKQIIVDETSTKRTNPQNLRAFIKLNIGTLMKLIKRISADFFTNDYFKIITK